MVRRIRCYICNKLKYPDEHFKKCELDNQKIFICSIICWDKYIEYWKNIKYWFNNSYKYLNSFYFYILYNWGGF